MKKMNGERKVKFSKKVDSFRKNCPNRIVHTITVIVELLWLFIAVIPNVKSALENGVSNDVVNAICIAIAIMLMIYMFIEIVIFDMEGRHVTKKNNIILNNYELSNDEFKEVLWRYYHVDDDVIRYMKSTIRNSEIKLYAKLIDSTDENRKKVLLISKDKDGKVLAEPVKIEVILFINNFILKR